MDVELPYSAEYAKSGRSSCKFCKKLIPLGSLRLAAMVQSAFHDAKQPMWFHEDCYFKKQRPHCIGDIENFENIRFEDQERIRKKVDAGLLVFAEGDKKGKKRTKEKNSALNDFGIEYAKSGRATCRGCEQKILKDQVRIRKTVYDTEVGMKYGGQPLWHHLECFVQLRSDLGWLESGDFLPGFKSLKKQDQSEVSKMIPFLKTETEPDFKKPKIEQDIKEEKKLNKLAEKQCKRLFKLRDLIAKHMQKRDIIYLLEYNNQDPVTGDSGKLLDQFADMVTFGALASCLQCKGRQILFSKFGYLCNGQLTEWTKCSNIIKEPQRTACKISNDLMEKYDFLSEIKNKPEERIIRYNPPSATVISSSLPVKKEEETNGFVAVLGNSLFPTICGGAVGHFYESVAVNDLSVM